MSEQAIRNGKLRPADLSFTPFGFIAWRWFPYYIQHEGRDHADIAGFGRYLNLGAVDYVTFGFAGTEIHLYGVADPRSGVGAVSVDGGTETKVDFYTAVRAGNKLLYSSPTLAPGTHTLKLRVDSTKNANSTGFTIAVDRVELR